jgi:tRNA threonylcarbamoyladenosine biosynthesis protein TsaE
VGTTPPPSPAPPARPEAKPGLRLEFALADEAATEALAARLSAMARRGDVIALRGDVGAGKTLFARAFIRARLRQDEDVPSPTFTLVQVYQSGNPEDPRIWHVDLFRLEGPEDAAELGVEEAFASGISLIEWPERIESLLPARRLDLTLLPGTTADARLAVVEGKGEWRDRLREAGLA